MHQDPEHEDYDDDEYNYYPEYGGYGYSDYSKKFNIDWAAWEKWLSKALKDIVEEDNNVWVVGGTKKNLSNNTLSDKYFMYLGSNKYDETVWKSKYFIKNDLNKYYKNHISNHASYFLNQPSYYRGLFDNLN